MKYLNEYVNTGDIKAETLISLMDIKDMDVRMQGIFSRNYSEDLISITNEDDKTIFELSRDSVFHLLPEGLFLKENQLKKGRKSNFDFEKAHKELSEQKEAILLFFSSFDTEYFKLNLLLEKEVNGITEKGNHIFRNNFVEEPSIDRENEYISKLKILLPFISYLRGNHILLVDILKNVLSAEKIEIRDRGALRKRFIIHREGLSKEEYQSMDENLITFFDFLHQWFLPVEVEYDYRIKDYTPPFILGNTLLLDYNTHL